jgi:hypothetical protein
VTNEAFARVKIDQLLKDADWLLSDGRSVRFEYPLDDGGRELPRSHRELSWAASLQRAVCFAPLSITIQVRFVPIADITAACAPRQSAKRSQAGLRGARARRLLATSYETT